MGRVSSAGDNAAMESFFSLLQKNVRDRPAGRHVVDTCTEGRPTMWKGHLSASRVGTRGR
jgi:hypothetical protein